MKTKYFRLHWRGNLADNVISGSSIADAFKNGGFGGGALGALDYYEEIKEFSREEKPILIWEEEYKEFVTPGSLFIAIVRKTLAEGEEKKVAFGYGRNVTYFSVEETPLEFKLTPISKEVPVT
jgi:hypothetical protein